MSESDKDKWSRKSSWNIQSWVHWEDDYSNITSSKKLKKYDIVEGQRIMTKIYLFYLLATNASHFNHNLWNVTYNFFNLACLNLHKGIKVYGRESILFFTRDNVGRNIEYMLNRR